MYIHTYVCMRVCVYIFLGGRLVTHPNRGFKLKFSSITGINRNKPKKQ